MNVAEIMSNLPKLEGVNPAFDLYKYEGVWLPAISMAPTLILHDQFQAQPSDIFLCSFPKTGTTWLKALAFAITTRHLFNENTTPLITSLSHECLPMMDDFANGLSDVSRNSPLIATYNPYHLFDENTTPLITSLSHECLPMIDDFANGPSDVSRNSPLIATHNPYHLLPKSINRSGSKIIYICREPKDTFTSMWHMENNMRYAYATTMEDRFEGFCVGKNVYGSYWDHVLGYWKAKNERPDEILFLKYEDVKTDTVFYVKKLAEFMGKPFSIDELKESVPEKIVRLCSFENLSSLEVNKTGKVKFLHIDNKVFFRKGKIGDWENLLTQEMGKRLDLITDQKLKETGLTLGLTIAT